MSIFQFVTLQNKFELNETEMFDETRVWCTSLRINLQFMSR